MKTCNSFRDLEQFGIRPLTGEADALGYRILCDLTEQGVKVFKECYGLPTTEWKYTPNGLAENWNREAVASVMLSDDSIVPLAIMGFYLKGYEVLLAEDGHHKTVYALEHDEKIRYNSDTELYEVQIYGDWQTWPSCYGRIYRIFRQLESDGKVVHGTRNIHQMSGRVS